MKRFVLVLFLSFLCLSAFSQTYRYRAYNYAFGQRDSYGDINWGDWKTINVLITIDFDNDFIKVYSAREQNYAIISYGESYKDGYGGESIDMSAVDEEGIECSMRLRVQSDGVAQLYSYYNNIAWVYSDLQRL